jgi:hypothetical protein
MSSLHPARRSAERFDSVLQGARGVSDTREQELLELVAALQTLPRAEARPEFVSDLRSQLMLAAATELVVPDSPAALEERLTVRTTRTPRERRLAVALGGFAIVGATTSMAVAAQSALPGDVLYPLKRAIENAETGFSVGDEAKGTTILENASGRLDEVDELTRDGQADPQVVSQTLQTFADQATEASELLIADYESTGSEQAIQDLQSFTSSSIETLAGLEALIPAEAEAALLDAAQVVLQIDSLVTDICPVCTSLIENIPLPLLASGGPALDDAQVAAGAPITSAAAPPPAEAKPDKGKGKKPPIKSDNPTVEPSTPFTLPSAPATAPNGPGNGGTGKGPKTPGVEITTAVPDLGIPVVDQVVEDVVEGVTGVLGGLTGGGK